MTNQLMTGKEPTYLMSFILNSLHMASSSVRCTMYSNPSPATEVVFLKTTANNRIAVGKTKVLWTVGGGTVIHSSELN
jgi:hypothetical protein